jgi:hypothetical protein
MYNFNAATSELIGLLLPEPDLDLSPVTNKGRPRASVTALVRKSDGQMALESVAADALAAREGLKTGCFRKSRAIIDPVSREVMGYEMEMVDSF